MFVRLFVSVATSVLVAASAIWFLFCVMPVSAAVTFVLRETNSPCGSTQGLQSVAEVPTRQNSLPVPSTLAVCFG